MPMLRSDEARDARTAVALAEAEADIESYLLAEHGKMQSPTLRSYDHLVIRVDLDYEGEE